MKFLLGGLACVVVGAAVIIRNESARRQLVVQSHPRLVTLPPEAVKHTAPPEPKVQYVCWMCSDKSVAPVGAVNVEALVTCPHCDTDNIVKLVILDRGEMYQGQMARYNRIAKYL